MSATEEIQAAIDKLTRLKSHGSDGKWRSTVSSGVASVTNEVGRGVAHHMPAPDADLIVTLHATIDAQLAILRNERWEVMRENRPPFNDIYELARAINGGA